MITDDVVALRDRLAIPGMRVLQFGFHEDRPTFHYPSTYPVQSVAFSGTHDLPTLRSWLTSAPPADVKRALRYARASKRSGVYGLLRAGLQSRSHLFIAQAQDIFRLGGTSRINIPGTIKNNWSWRLPIKLLSHSAAQKLKTLTKEADRA
jgi:4-alpha-glucanotransferase